MWSPCRMRQKLVTRQTRRTPRCRRCRPGCQTSARAAPRGSYRAARPLQRRARPRLPKLCAEGLRRCGRRPQDAHGEAIPPLESRRRSGRARAAGQVPGLPSSPLTLTSSIRRLVSLLLHSLLTCPSISGHRSCMCAVHQRQRSSPVLNVHLSRLVLSAGVRSLHRPILCAN